MASLLVPAPRGNAVLAHHATVSEDHRLAVSLPTEIPAGHVEVIVLFHPQPIYEKPDLATQRLAALQRARERFGAYLSSSEEFANSKREEIALYSMALKSFPDPRK